MKEQIWLATIPSVSQARGSKSFDFLPDFVANLESMEGKRWEVTWGFRLRASPSKTRGRGWKSGADLARPVEREGFFPEVEERKVAPRDFAPSALVDALSVGLGPLSKEKKREEKGRRGGGGRKRANGLRPIKDIKVLSNLKTFPKIDIFHHKTKYRF